MNLLPLAAGRDGAVIAGTAGPALLPASCAGGQLGVRPEHITLTFERGVPAAVENVEYLGGDSLLACRVGAHALAVRVPGTVALRPGEAAWLTWSPGAQHYFDATGTRTAMPSERPLETRMA
jgi:sn-glycerol 3-phosphate transport system ATP-binding protein